MRHRIYATVTGRRLAAALAIGDFELLFSRQAYYSNRSAAWAHLNKHEDALKDAQKCVERDPNFIKGARPGWG